MKFFTQVVIPFSAIMLLVLGCEKDEEPTPPKVEIISPSNGAVFFEGDTIEFSGKAVDSDGGTDCSIAWRSNEQLLISKELSFKSADLEVGEHNIKMTAIDKNYNHSKATIKITIKGYETQADFYIPSDEIFVGAPITFYDTSTHFPTSWNWDFGDGNTSKNRHPEHTYLNTGNYNITLTVSNEINQSTLTKKVVVLDSCNGCREDILTDIDGNEYWTVKIGNKWWMAQNLAVTHHNDGHPIKLVESDSIWHDNAWSTVRNNGYPAYCWYDNDSVNNKSIYGALYHLKVNTTDICPTGWHIPDMDEWQALFDYVGGSEVAGGMLKGLSFWEEPNKGAIDKFGFAMRPGGKRKYNGDFGYLKRVAFLWSSSKSPGTNGLRPIEFSYSSKALVLDDGLSWSPGDGASIRCVKDE